MEKVKANNYIKSLLTAAGYTVQISNIKSVERYEMPPFKEINHRIIFKIETKDNRKFELLLETVDKNGDFSINSARYALRGIKEI